MHCISPLNAEDKIVVRLIDMYDSCAVNSVVVRIFEEDCVGNGFPPII